MWGLRDQIRELEAEKVRLRRELDIHVNREVQANEKLADALEENAHLRREQERLRRILW